MLKESSGLWSFHSEDGNDFEVLKETMSTEEVVSIREESLLDKLFGNAAPGLSSDGPLSMDYLSVGVLLLPFLFLYCCPYQSVWESLTLSFTCSLHCALFTGGQVDVNNMSSDRQSGLCLDFDKI